MANRKVVIRSALSAALSLGVFVGLMQTTPWSAVEEPVLIEGKVVPAEIEGVVVAAYDNEIALVKHGKGYLLVRLQKKHWELGITRGDKLQITGKLTREKSVTEVLQAEEVTKVGKQNLEEARLGLITCREVRNMQSGGQLVGVRGTITETTPRRCTIKDSDDSIGVNLTPEDNRSFLWAGLDVLVIGTVNRSIMGNSIDPVAVIPAVRFQREGEPEKALTVAEILKAKPVGKLVRAHGRLALFLGEENGTILYQGEDILIVRRADKYLSFDPQAGREAEVVGIFGYETHKGREYGVLKEARIDPPHLTITKPMQP